MDFRFCCPKCSSTTIYVDADPRVSWEEDRIIRCYTCGWSLYGKEKAQAAVEEQYKVFLKEKRADQVRRSEVSRRREIYDINAWERRHKEAQQLLISKGLCASIDCSKGPAAARGNSIYCSRSCCVRNAHRRERERKCSKKAQADVAA
jgi:hypothetical protein